MATGVRIDDGGKVSGKIVGSMTHVVLGKRKRDLQGDLWSPDRLTVSPRLTVNRDLTARKNCVQERLAVASEKRIDGPYARKQRDAFSIGSGDFVDPGLFSGKHPHLDHGYAMTSHYSQGQTADRVLIHVDTELGAIVSISTSRTALLLGSGWERRGLRPSRVQKSLGMRFLPCSNLQPWRKHGRGPNAPARQSVR